MAKTKNKRPTRIAPAGRTAVKQQRQKKQEITRLGAALRTLGGLGGAALGGMVGHAGVGAGYGTGIGAALSKWLGSGDYKVSENSVVRATLNSSDGIPAMHNTGQSITVRHKEFLTEVKGSIGFTVQRFFVLQPGDVNTFPWLSGIASKFQQYRIKGMVFHYVPTSGYAVSGANPAIGSVMLQTTYRVNDSQPLSKVEMLNEYWASEAAPSEAFCHPIECSPKENPFSVHYVHTSAVPTSDSPLMYDLGKTYVATSGMPGDGNVVGDLWVTYEIELSKPVVTSSVSSDLTFTFGAASSPVVGNWFGASPVYVGNLGVTVSGNVLSFPIGIVGTYYIVVRIRAQTTFTAGDLSGAPSLANCVSGVVDQSGLNYVRTVLGGAGGTLQDLYYMTTVVLTNTAAVATVTYPAGTWTGTALNSYVTISQLL